MKNQAYASPTIPSIVQLPLVAYQIARLNQRIRASGEIGIHARLKILWAYAREGSSPSSPTK